MVSLSTLHNFTKRLAIISALFTVLFTAPFFTSEAQANAKYASLVMDADTGQILHQRHADKRLHPASITKVMTLLMVFDALEDGRIRMRDRIKISKNAASKPRSKLDLKAGSTIRVRDAIYSLVTKSANDVATAVAEHLSGSESKFAAAMTRRARAIGMTHTNFRNASGLHHRRQISTARDISKMAHYVISRYPEYYKLFSRRSFTYKGKTYRNHNRLLGQYKGMDGMKTGYINASGYNLVASAKRDGRRIIAVVLGGRSGKTRNIHMASLLDRGFKKVTGIKYAALNAPLPLRKPGQGSVLAMNNLNNIQPASGMNSGDHNTPSPYSDMKQRLETGMIAISAIKGEPMARPMLASFTPQNDLAQDWAVQVGAYWGRTQTNKALNASIAQLPQKYHGAQARVSPLKTRNGWLFRARLEGFSKAQAHDVCRYVNDCIPLAP